MLELKCDPNIFYYDGEKNVYDNRHDLLASEKSPIKKLYYYDKEFGTVDWKNEPIEDLQTLYKQRAQQIRDDYDYVILCYSGGIDSTTVLESFYYNNIHLDEILVVGAFSQDSVWGSDENHNGDIYHNVYPTLNKMDLKNTKITIKDYTDYFNDPNNFTLIQQCGTEFAKFIGSYTSVHNLFWYDLKKFIGQQNNKKTCYIMASDKPSCLMELETGRFYTHFNDMSVLDYAHSYNDENFVRLNFYSHPKAERVIRKQVHTMMKYYVKNVLLEKNITHQDYNEKYISIVNNTVYNLKNPLVHKSKKSVSSHISVRDMFILNKQDSDMFKIYKDATLKLDRRIVKLKKSFHTRRYYLTEQDPCYMPSFF